MRLFDSIAHPSIDGSWLGKPHHNSFDNLITAYKAEQVAGGCAVSLPFIEDEQLAEFYKKCDTCTAVKLYPVAAFNFTEPDFEEKIRKIKAMGYNAIKIHTRLSKLDIDADYNKLRTVFTFCEQYNLIIFFCTYYHTNIECTPLNPLSYYLIKLLKAAPKLKIILLHGGDVNVMQMAQLARFNSNILIDLSYTFIKFRGSSVEQDIIYLMNNFDRKICFGSDYPEYSITQFKQEFIELLTNVKDANKAEYISSRNITGFLDIAL
jgi:predicted TIM-barrel fold metal-dependent hydrolase